MGALSTQAPLLLATGVSINLNSGTKQTVYTVPTGMTAVILGFVIRGASATAATGVLSIGGDGTPSDFGTGINLTNLTNATSRMVFIERVPAATPATAVEYAAATAIGIKPTTTVAATALVDVIGYLH